MLEREGLAAVGRVRASRLRSKARAYLHRSESTVVGLKLAVMEIADFGEWDGTTPVAGSNCRECALARVEQASEPHSQAL